MYAPTMADRVAGSAALRRRQALGRILAGALGRVQLVGLDNVPPTGGVLLAGNHRSALDGPPALNRRVVAAAAERVRLAPADLVTESTSLRAAA